MIELKEITNEIDNTINFYENKMLELQQQRATLYQEITDIGNFIEVLHEMKEKFELRGDSE